MGRSAFFGCKSLEALFLPSTVKATDYEAFKWCGSLRLLLLPHDIDPSNIGTEIIHESSIIKIAAKVGVRYLWRGYGITDESSLQVNEWMIRHMDEAPFHKLCFNSSITTKHINNYLTENENDSTLAIDTMRGMTPLLMLSMNPRAPAFAIAALLNSNMEAVFCL